MLSNGWNLNDNVSSLWNYTNNWAIFYTDAGFNSGSGDQDYTLCVAPGNAVRNLTNIWFVSQPSGFFGLNWNDSVSSHRLVSRPPTQNDCTNIIIGQPGCSI